MIVCRTYNADFAAYFATAARRMGFITGDIHPMIPVVHGIGGWSVAVMAAPADYLQIVRAAQCDLRYIFSGCVYD